MGLVVASEGYGIAIALPGVGRKIHAVGVQTVYETITSNDRVIVARANPVVGSGGPMQINPGGHADCIPSVQL